MPGKPYIFGGKRPAVAIGGGRVQAAAGQNNKGKRHMGRIIKTVLVLGLLGFVALTGYAYLGDLAPDQVEVRKPVVLDAN